jgi:CRISPR/Cas system-associated exonuclease Cas4 (RecB family)
MRTSYSSLDTFKSCPLKYKYEQIDKIRAPKTREQIFGGSIHSTLKYMFERKPLYPTLNQVIDFFRNIWPGGEKEEEYFKEGITLLEKFSRHNQPWNFNVVDLESRFEVVLEEPKAGEKHILAGVIDRIDKNDDVYEIIDYKTSRKMPDQQNIDNDFQMSIYHLGLIKRWPHLDPHKIKLSFYYLKHGEKISTSRTAEQLEETKKYIFKAIGEINERIKDNYNFPPYPSGLCDYCGYRQMCPMWKHLYDQKYAKLDDSKIREIVKEYFELKEQNEKNSERLNELKTIIYGFMDDQKIGRVFGEEGYLTRKIQERFSYDLEKIKEILEPVGKWQEILSADEKKLEKLLSSFPDDIQEKILALRATKQFPILTASKKKIEMEEK